MTNTPSSHRSQRGGALALATLLACVAGCMLASTPALAEFSRSYLGQLTGTCEKTGETPPSCAGFVPFGKNGLIDEEGLVDKGSVSGLAVGPLGEVYVGESGEEPLKPSASNGYANERGFNFIDEFNSANQFVTPQITSLESRVESLAYDDQSDKLLGGVGGDFYEYIAVDDTTSLFTAGDIYSTLTPNSETPPAIRRVNAEGEPAPFSCQEAGKTPEYIRNGDELTGKPGETWGVEPEAEEAHPALRGIAVDPGSGRSAGDIYVLNSTNAGGGNQIDQFTADGCFVRAITEAAVPGAKEIFSELFGVAADPKSGDVLVEAEGKGESSGVQAIYEFGEAGEYLGALSGRSKSEPFGGGAEAENLRGSLAVNSSGDVYVDVLEQRSKDVVDEFGPGAFFPDAVTGEANDATGALARLNGVVRGVANAEGVALPMDECRFEYVSEKTFEKEEFAAAAVAPCVLESGSSPVGQAPGEKNYAVHGQASGLKEGEVYDYRLVAKTGGEHGGTIDGEVESFAAPGRPTVEAVSVGNVSSSFADFSARIDPVGSATKYEFQYVPAGVYEAALAAGAADPYAGGGSAPAGGGEAGAGDRTVGVRVAVGGLSPGTAYDYRVVAANGVGASDSADGAFATVPAGLQGLPDGRAYELVTPANKGDAEDMFGQVALDGGARNADFGFASEDGEHFLLWTKVAFGSFPASAEGAYVFSRGDDGWSFQSVVSPGLGVQGVIGLLFDPSDLSMVAVQDEVGHNGERIVGLNGPPGAPVCEGSGSSGGCYATMVDAHTSAEVQYSELPVVVGGSGDLGHTIVEGTGHQLALCEAAQQTLEGTLAAGSNGLFEWSAGSGCLSLVDVKSRSESGGLLSKCGAVLGRGQSGGFPGSMRGAVSEDGSKVFFTAPDPAAKNDGAGCWNGAASDTPQLYMRVDGETTVAVSAPETGVKPEKTFPAIYIGAAADGSRVFFMTKTQLTADAVAARTHDMELYEYDTETGKLARVSRGQSGEAEGNVDDVPAISADGSSVYFNAQGDLAPGGEHGGLYLYDTLTGTTSYVAPEQGYPVEKKIAVNGGGEDVRAAWWDTEVNDELVPSLELETPYQTTRDGQFLLFGAYRYDAADGSVVCVMCNPDGSGPIADATFIRSADMSSNPAGGPVRGMSENGQYVFFDTAEALVPQDTNGKLDVYEWHDGTISLISSGEDPRDSYFLGSSSYVNAAGETVEGGNVFFGTHAKLVPEDTDSSGDVYDARIGGGFATSTDSGPCEGDACESAPPAPLQRTPGSVSFSGPGDIASEVPPPVSGKVTKTVKCKKGEKLSHGRCTKIKSKRPKKAKKAKKATRANGERGVGR